MQSILPTRKSGAIGFCQKVFLLKPGLFVISMLVANLFLLQKSAAQTTVVAQNFDAINTMTVSISGGTTQTGNSSSSDRPASSAFFTSSTTARRVTNNTSTLTFGNVTGLSANASKYFEFRLAAWSIGTSSNGIDPGDDVRVDVSLDGGTTWSSELIVTGPSANNAYWHYTTGTGIASVNYDGNNSATSFAPAGSGSRTTDGYSTVRVSLPVSATQARLRIVMDNSSTSEAFTIDDVKLALPAYASNFISMSTGTTNWCAGETRNISLTLQNTGTASWVDGGTPDVNIGLKWNTNGASWNDYHLRTDAGNLASGATQTYNFTITASNYVSGAYTTVLSAGTNNLSFDIVKEGDCWFGNNNGSCGPGNLVSVSANQTIVAAPTAVAGTAVNTCSNASPVNVTAGSSATGQASVQWSSSGTGSFSNATSLTTATYTPSGDDITAGSVILTLTAFPNSPCAANATSTKTLTINQAPTSVAGTAVTTCSTSGTVNITAGSSATNQASITWSVTSGTGTLTNANSLTTASYAPSAGDITAGSRTIVLTAVGLAGCANATSNKTITITSAPTAVAGTAVNTCSNSVPVNITAGSSSLNNSGITWSTPNGTGTFTNENSLTLATYEPSAADIIAGGVTITLTATPNSPCAANATSNKTLTINAPPTAVAGTDVLTCSSSAAVNITAGSSATGQASITWTTSNGTGTFANSTSLTTATYNPSAADKTAGVRTLVLTAIGMPGCSNVTDTKLINITTAPTAVAGTAIVTCANSGAVDITTGSSATNNTGVTWTSSGSGTFTNDNSLTLATYDPSVADIAAGSVTLTLTSFGNAPCGNTTSNKTFTINPIPTTSGVTICQGTLSFPSASLPMTSSYTCASGAPVTAGPNFAGAGANSGGGGTAWTNPGNVVSNNGSNATVSMTNNGTSQALNATGFLFGIPANATITAIVVSIERNRSGGGFGEVQDNSVRLLKAGTATGDNDGATSTNWPTSVGVATYNGSTNALWGTTWTPAQINASNFGVALAVDFNSSFTRTANVDYITISVSYTEPGSLNWYTVASGGTSIGSGLSFDPVGVAGSGLPNTGTAGTTIFYAECETVQGCRTPTNYVINELPVVNFTGLAADYCVYDAAVTLTGNHAPAGTFSGPGITDNADGTASFNPATAGAGGPYSITYSFTDGNSCLNAETQLVTVKPLPVLSSTLTPMAVCNNSVFSYIPTSITPSTTFNWTRAVVAGISNAASSGSNDPNETLVNTTDAPVSVTYEYTLSSNGCSNIQNVVVFVNPTANIDAVGNASYCNGAAAAGISFSSTTTGGTITYSWTSTANVGFGTSGNGNIDPYTATNTGNAQVVATVNVTAYFDGCAGNSTSFTITVDPNGTIELTSLAGTDAQTVCIDNAITDINYTIGGTSTGASMTAGALPAGVSGSFNLGVFTITGTPTASGTFSYTITTSGPCINNSISGTITVDPLPTVGSITGPVAVCIHTSESGLAATYSVTTTDPLSLYTWTVPAGSTGLTGQGTNTISFKYPAGFSVGSVDVSVQGTCGDPVLRSLSVSTTVPVTPAAIIGEKNVCPYVGTVTQITYSIVPVADAITYRWTLPPFVNLISATPDSTSIKVTFSAAFGTSANRQIRVRSISGCGNSGQAIIYLVAQYASTPQPISGPTDVCPYLGNAVEATYVIPRILAASEYIWTAQAGTTTITHPNGPGENDTIVKVIFDAGFTTSLISVRAANDCGISSARSLNIVRTIPSTPGLITGPTDGCAYMQPLGAIATYKIRKMQNADSYNWTAPPGSIVNHENAPGVNDTLITVSLPSNFTTGFVTVTATNGCGTSTVPRKLAIGKLNPGTPSVMDIIQIGSCPNRQYTYTLIGMPLNATSVVWTVPASAISFTGQGTTSITVTYPSTAVTGNVTAQGISNCGSSVVRSSEVKLPICPPEDPFHKSSDGQAATPPIASATKESAFAGKFEVSVYPNPTTSNFNVKVIAAGKTKVQVRVLDMQGRQIKNLTVMPYQTFSIGSELQAGNYFIEVTQGQFRRTEKLLKF